MPPKMKRYKLIKINSKFDICNFEDLNNYMNNFFDLIFLDKDSNFKNFLIL